MRKLKVLLTSLTILLVFSAPALAQSAPAAGQYGVDKTCPNGFEDDGSSQGDAASVGDGPCAAAENAGQGTAAVNEALSATDSSTSASAESSAESSAGVSASSGSSASADARSEAVDETAASITQLPETGGAPPATLGLGAVLVALGLTARRAVRR